MDPQPTLSLILPAFNESEVVGGVVTTLKARFPEAEVLVVDDGSKDGTGDAARAAGARVVRHPYNMGNGAAVKTGARHARGDTLVFMDSDGQHKAEDIPLLLDKLNEGYAMAVGARSSSSQANAIRRLGNGLLNRFASTLTGQEIPDLTSGFRAMRAHVFRQFLYLIPNGFSYPTTSTMVFMRSGFPVGFVPIQAAKRKGSHSKIKILRDGTNFFIIIMKVILLFSPMRVFFPTSVLFFLMGLSRYIYTYLDSQRLTNMPVLLFVAAILTFLIGLISEQITAMHLGASVNRVEEENGREHTP